MRSGPSTTPNGRRQLAARRSSGQFRLGSIASILTGSLNVCLSPDSGAMQTFLDRRLGPEPDFDQLFHPLENCASSVVPCAKDLVNFSSLSVREVMVGVTASQIASASVASFFCPFDIGLYIRRRHQSHCMPQRPQFTRPMVS